MSAALVSERDWRPFGRIKECPTRGTCLGLNGINGLWRRFRGVLTFGCLFRVEDGVKKGRVRDCGLALGKLVDVATNDASEPKVTHVALRSSAQTSKLGHGHLRLVANALAAAKNKGCRRQIGAQLDN